MKYCFGVDIGGTTIKIGLFDDTGNSIEKWQIPTRKGDCCCKVIPDLIGALLGKIEEKNITKEEMIGIGLGAPGPVSKEGILFDCPNMGWEDRPLAKEVSQAMGIENVKLGNDANVAALGEEWQLGKGEGVFVMVTLGTGVGGGVIVDGKILEGNHGAGGEIGHLVVNRKEEEYCGCGKKGCLEQYASATGIVRLTKKALAKTEIPSVLRKEKEVTAKEVLDAAKNHDVLADQVMECVCDYLGMALANMTCVVDPGCVVIGGGVSKAGAFLVEKIKKHYMKYAFSDTKEVVFSIATLGNDAGIYGCARMILGVDR